MSEHDTAEDGTEVERGNQCEMCDSYDDVKAVRDPEDNLLDMCADCRSGWPVEVVGDAVATDGGVDMSKFSVEVNDDVTLRDGDLVEHVEHGPMIVDSVAVGSSYKWVTFKSDTRGDNMSIELTGEKVRDQWGEKIAKDPFDLHEPGTATFTKELASKDDSIEISIEVSGPQDDAEPVMAHLDDQAVRALQAMETKSVPEDCEGKYTIDWESVHAEDDDE